MPTKGYTRSAFKGRKRRRKSKNFVAIPFEAEVALAALADDIVVSNGILGAVLGEDLKIISIDAVWSIKDYTVGEGPILVGFNHSDLSDAEIAEALSAQVVNPSDIIAKERSKRPVRKAGMFRCQDPGFVETLNDGVAIRTRCLFNVSDGLNPEMFCQNKSGAVLAGGAIVDVVGTLYGNWLI